MDPIVGPPGWAKFLFSTRGANIYVQETGDFLCPQLYYWQFSTSSPVASKYYGGFSSLEICLRHIENMASLPDNVIYIDFVMRTRSRITT